MPGRGPTGVLMRTGPWLPGVSRAEGPP
jgi:hypothetical protein